MSATMKIHLLLFAAMLVAYPSCVSLQTCPCRRAEWCQPLQTPPGDEVFAFVLASNETVWGKFNWSKLTTVALAGFLDPQLLCHAHQHGVRVVYLANYPVAMLSNGTYRTQWVQQQVRYALNNFLDGVNIDFEDPIDRGTPQTAQLTALVAETTSVFHSTIPSSQVTFDIAWSPAGIDGRFYDAVGLSKSADFLFVMSYDEQSQIFDTPCTARANSGFRKTVSGIQQFMQLNIPPKKLVLGVPWYGYNYECLNLIKNDTCIIQEVPFRGVNCSDAAGSQLPYTTIMEYLAAYSTSGRKWDPSSMSPYFNFKDPHAGAIHQMWYDDPSSLLIKYNYALAQGLRGVGMWTANFLDYSGSATGNKQVKEMWDALPSYRNAI